MYNAKKRKARLEGKLALRMEIGHAGLQNFSPGFEGGNMAERIGDFLMRIGAITATQVDEVLAIQKGGDSRPFGVIAVELGYVDESAIEKFAAAQKV